MVEGSEKIRWAAVGETRHGLIRKEEVEQEAAIEGCCC